MDYIKEKTNGALDAKEAIGVLREVREEITNLWLEKFSSGDNVPTAEYIEELSGNRMKLSFYLP